MTLIRTSLGEVACHIAGSGPPLFLLHANGHDHHVFDAVTPALAQRFRTIAIDWPAMGDSPPPSRPASASLFADLLEEVVDTLDAGPAAFIGNSVGGFAAARLAARRPAMVRSLVLVNSGGFTPMNALARAFCRFRAQRWFVRLFARAFARLYLHRRNRWVNDILARIDVARRRDDYLAVETSVWRHFPDADSDLSLEARRVVCPTLLLWGRRDPISRARVEGKAAREAMPRARYVELDCGHVAFAEEPDAFLAAASEVLGT